MNIPQKQDAHSAGFTLVEVMVTMVIAFVILGGLMLNFLSQSSQYKVQDKRVDSTQDLEFAIRYIASDLQAALIKADSAELNSGTGTASVLFAAASDPYSTGYLSFDVWDAQTVSDVYTRTGIHVAYERVKRCYRYRTSGTSAMLPTLWQVYYKRHEPDCSASIALGSFDQIIGEPVEKMRGMRVTHFRIFLDDPADKADRDGFSNIPPPLPPKVVRDISNTQYNMPGFTILLEVEVDTLSQGAPKDVRGQVVTNGKSRIWRYVQVYPAVVVSQ